MTDEIIGNARVLGELGTLASGVDVPHALLLTGPAGTGRTAIARRFASMLNCLESPGTGPCGECRACRLIANDSHPDVAVVAPGDAFCKPRPDESHTAHPQSRDIRICQVRGVIDAVARYPVEARYRVLIIEPADAATEQASQAFLKTLEEPPPHTVFVLVTESPERLLETIRSRCRRIDARPVPRAEIEAALQRRGIAPEIAGRAAEASRGRPARALDIAANPELLHERDERLAACRELLGKGLQARFARGGELAERWRNRRETVYEELDLWETLWAEALHEAAAGRGAFSPQEIVDALRAVEQCRADLAANVMTRAAIERMLILFPVGTMGGIQDEPGGVDRMAPVA